MIDLVEELKGDISSKYQSDRDVELGFLFAKKDFYRRFASAREIITMMKMRPADSYTESAFASILYGEKIPFEFQVCVGRYRVDFLIGGFLVFEGDGDQHFLTQEYDQIRDDYLRSIGLKVMRFNWRYVLLGQREIVEAIKATIDGPKPDVDYTQIMIESEEDKNRWLIKNMMQHWND